VISPTVPSGQQLLAARLVLCAIGEGVNEQVLRASLGWLPTDGVVSTVDLEEAIERLCELGLAERDGLQLVPTPFGRVLQRRPCRDAALAIVERSLEVRQPLWLCGAVEDGELVESMIPREEWARVASLTEDGDVVGAVVRAAGKVDAARLAWQGLRGEECVVREWCEALRVHGRSDLAGRVQRVSEISDAFGYDVCGPDFSEQELHVEVKAVADDSRGLRVFLSRNEAAVGERDDAWRLVVCCVAGEESRIIGWCGFNALRAMLPTDQSAGGRWEAVRLHLNPCQLNAGLPIK